MSYTPVPFWPLPGAIWILIVYAVREALGLEC